MVDGYLVLSEIIRGEEHKKRAGENCRPAAGGRNRESVCWKVDWVGEGARGVITVHTEAARICRLGWEVWRSCLEKSSEQPADTLETAKQTDGRHCCQVKTKSSAGK